MEKDKTPEEELSEVEIGNLPEKEFRVMIIKNNQRTQEKNKCTESEVFNKELENINKNQTDENTITKMKNTLKGINSSLNDSEE